MKKTSSPSRLILSLGLWAVLAVLAGASQLLLRLPPFVVPALVAGLTVSLSVATTRVGWLRATVGELTMRQLLAIHLVRFVGVSFLFFEHAGRLPHEFAQRAGWGDIAAATGALILIFVSETPMSRRALFWWNVFGAADLLVAVGTAGWLNLTRPGSMIEMSRLPLTLVPLFIVPVLMAGHVVLLRRIRASAPTKFASGAAA